MPLAGDVAELERLRKRLADGAALVAIAETELQKRIEARVEREYETGTDPDGVAWAALKPSTLASGRRPPPLTASGEMRASSKVLKGVGGVAGVTVAIDKPSKPTVPNFHQEGTERMAARPLVPTGDELPAAWREDVVASVERALKLHFGGSP